jgi:hypothetical protein
LSSSDVILALCQISVIAGGVEEGKYKGKLHLQIALEWWDDEGLAQPTISKHIRATIQPLLDGLLDTEENETWPLKIKAIPKVKGVRAKGGWFYQVAYTPSSKKPWIGASSRRRISERGSIRSAQRPSSLRKGFLK